MKKLTVFKSNILKIESVEIGMLGNNVYYISSASNLAIVDPSCRAEDLIAYCEGKIVDKILLTHYHFDHIGAAQDVKDEFGAKCFASVGDHDFITGITPPPVSHRRINTCEVDVKIAEGDLVDIGQSKWKVIETPGHTMGGICFYCEDTGLDADGIKLSPVLICGDTLFKCSCGRTDFVDSDPLAMKNSLAKLGKLSDETIVLPGHGDITTIGAEKNYMLLGL